MIFKLHIHINDREEIYLSHLSSKQYAYWSGKSTKEIIENITRQDKYIHTIMPKDPSNYNLTLGHRDYHFEPNNTDILLHEVGNLLSRENVIDVLDEKGRLVFHSSLNKAELKNYQCQLMMSKRSKRPQDLTHGLYLFIRSIDRGIHSFTELDLNEDFNPKKLKFKCIRIAQYSLVKELVYDEDQFIDFNCVGSQILESSCKVKIIKSNRDN